MNWFQSNVSNKPYTMEQVYEVAGISRQGHYSHQKRLASKLAKTEALLSGVRAARLSHPRMGSRPLYKLLNVEGIGINQFEKLLAREGLGIKRKRNRHKTTDGSKYKGGLSNLLNGRKINTINQVWVSDITYFQVKEKTFYIIILMDIYSRKILGCEVYENMLAKNTISVLKQALKYRSRSFYDNTLIHHSDKGSQYMSTDYKKLLSDFEIRISVAKNSLQNGYAERINSTIKNDYLNFHKTEDLKKLRRNLKYCVWLYNNERPHSSLDYLSPVAFERLLSEQPNAAGKQMILYDFTQDYTVEFFEGIGQSRNHSFYHTEKGSEEPDFSTVQDYSLKGCSPAEPFSASSCDTKVIRFKNKQ